MRNLLLALLGAVSTLAGIVWLLGVAVGLIIGGLALSGLALFVLDES